jgi:8-oxo-dGTP pyrophosphatase MutT (NUDIX family)
MEEHPDIAWRDERHTFKHRVTAVIKQDDKILLCDLPSLDYTFLPGGKVRFGENTGAAVRRELAEELGIEFSDATLCLVLENIYIAGGSLQHELCFFYRVGWPSTVDEAAVNASTEAEHHFTWVPLRELDKARFEPAELIPGLLALNDTIQHMVLDRRDAAQKEQAVR